MGIPNVCSNSNRINDFKYLPFNEDYEDELL